MEEVRKITITSGIYKITNKDNWKCYIGASSNIEKRWDAHKRLLGIRHHYNKHLQEDWSLFGDISFKFQILEEVSIYDLKKKEDFWINEFQSFKISRGYNSHRLSNLRDYELIKYAFYLK